MRHTILLTFFAATLCSFSVAQNSVTIASDPKDLSRPVSTLLNQLRRLERTPVTYEDPRYAKRDDMEGKDVHFTYSVEEMHSPGGPELIIARMLREYGASGGLTFSVVRDGPRLHVVPNEVLDRAGARMSQDSILDTMISVPEGRRNGGELLEAICNEVRKQTGYEIGIGPSVPGNYLAVYKTAAGIQKLSARSAIADLLDRSSVPGTFDWDLYYDPSDKAYMLNFSYVGPAGPVEKTAR